VPSHGALIALPAEAVETPWKEREDDLEATVDAQREAEEERLATVMAENIHDAAQEGGRAQRYGSFPSPLASRQCRPTGRASNVQL
jgi:hypothetical protein